MQWPPPPAKVLGPNQLENKPSFATQELRIQSQKDDLLSFLPHFLNDDRRGLAT